MADLGDSPQKISRSRSRVPHAQRITMSPIHPGTVSPNRSRSPRTSEDQMTNEAASTSSDVLHGHLPRSEAVTAHELKLMFELDRDLTQGTAVEILTGDPETLMPVIVMGMRDLNLNNSNDMTGSDEDKLTEMCRESFSARARRRRLQREILTRNNLPPAGRVSTMLRARRRDIYRQPGPGQAMWFGGRGPAENRGPGHAGQRSANQRDGHLPRFL